MSAPEPYWADDRVTLHLGDCLDILPSLEAGSVDAVVTDAPYGLEFMGKEWDSFRTGDGFRRSRNPADAGRDNVFGRTSRTGPEYRTGDEAWRTGAGMSKPGIGPRPTEWPSFGGKDGANATCATCGGRMRGARKCACAEPDWRVKGRPLGERAGTAHNLRAYQAWCEAWAAECLRVLKPGGYMLTFGGTRTWHRLACGIEDAGFEIRDSTADLTGQDAPGLMWVNASGFPKSLNAGRAIDMHACELPGRHHANKIPDDPKPDDHVCPRSPQGDPWRGHGTAAKPAWEPIIVGRKPLTGTLAVSLLEHGTGALNIDGCRVHSGPSEGGSISGSTALGQGSGWNAHNNRTTDIDRTMSAGRWPPNVLLGPDAAAELDRQSGVTASRAGAPRRSASPGNGYGMVHTGTEYEDSGGASRFFPVFRFEAKAGTDQRPRGDDGTGHPTVKPLDLVRWKVRLVTPPGGLVLDLFAGSGTTGEACIIEGFRCVLIEKDPASVGLIRTRLRKPIQPDIFGGVA